MNKTRILYLSHSAYINGAEMALLTLLESIDRERYEPIVVFPGEGPLKDKINDLGIRTCVRPVERWIRYPDDQSLRDTDVHTRVRGITNIIEEEAIDIVHTNTSIIFEGAIAAKIKNVPHVWHIHESLAGHPELKPLIPLPLINWGIVYLSEAVVVAADSIKKQFLPVTDGVKLVTIYNGINKEKFRKAHGDQVRREVGLSNNDIVAVTVGGLTERKGYMTWLQAVRMAKARGANIKFLWVGPASHENQRNFNEKLDEWELHDSVFYLGFREDIPSVISAADFYILSSMNEAFPLVVLEAMAAGKPVIATNCGGIEECISDSQNGFVVPAGDSDRLCERILSLAADKALIHRMGQESVRRFDADFDAAIFAKRFEDLYDCLTASTGKGREQTPLESLLSDQLLYVYEDISKIEEQKRYIAERDRRIEELLHSWSWKVTWPLRKLLGLLLGERQKV